MRLSTTVTVLLVALTAAGCASAPHRDTSPSARTDQLPAGSSPGERIVRIAAGLIGTPYKYGGKDPQHGFDCSGLVFYSFERVGIAVPRTAADQRRAARSVSRNDLEPGDLVFFRSGRRVDHVAIYAGRGKFIHAPKTGRVVTYGYLDDPYYRAHYVSAGRLLP